jgi:serine/threonine protein kinase
MRKYRLVAKKGEGTFSEVLKAQNVKDGKYHAIKCMKSRFESIDQVNNLREIQALRRLSPHEHIIALEEVLYDQPTGRLALVFELMDANLYELIKGRRHYLNPQLIKGYMWQLMKSLDHMHRKGIFHRDIKPENILIENTNDMTKGLKLADLGSCRGIYSKQPYTEYISTRWYRAPECLLTDGYYGPEMDLWGAGCVMFEITSLYPLFPGSNEVDQINRIHKVLGTPSTEILNKFRTKGSSHISLDFPEVKGIGITQLLPHAPADSVDLIVKLLKYDAAERISAREAMRHSYFKECREADARRAQLAQSVNNSNSGGGGGGGGGVSGVTQTTQNQKSTASDQIVKMMSKSGESNTGKALPSITGTSATFDTPLSKIPSMAGGENPSNLSHKLVPSGNVNNTGAKSNIVAVGTSGQPSVLPPIVAGGNVATTHSKAGGNTMIPQQKKKKKESARLRRNVGGAQNAESVLKAYGVTAGNSTVDPDLGITSGNNISYSSNHPQNRGYGTKR